MLPGRHAIYVTSSPISFVTSLGPEHDHVQGGGVGLHGADARGVGLALGVEPSGGGGTPLEGGVVGVGDELGEGRRQADVANLDLVLGGTAGADHGHHGTTLVALLHH